MGGDRKRPFDPARRDAVKALSLGALAFSVGGTICMLTPTEAWAESIPFKTLSQTEARTLSALGETIAPGARAAGIAHFVDHQISVDPENALMTLRYLDVPPPWAGFYQAGIAAIEHVAQTHFDKSFHELDSGSASSIVGGLLAGGPKGWPDDAPPAFLFYFAFRSDCVDVTYGTLKGFEALNVPYLAHLEPEAPW